MTEKRKSLGENERLILFTEVEGFCPLCSESFIYEKNKKKYKNFDAAHIYPLNPNNKEIELLLDEERISEDINDLDNFIALCRTCHARFDAPRTIEEYRVLLNLKKNILQTRTSRMTYSRYDLEDEIKKVLSKLADVDDADIIPLELSALKIDMKDNGTIEKLTKRKIKGHIVEYFNYVQKTLKEIDSEIEGTFEMIAIQIKSHSKKLEKDGLNQEQIYNSLVDWITRKTGYSHKEACSIIVSFFIQNCEVFNVSTK